MRGRLLRFLWKEFHDGLRQPLFVVGLFLAPLFLFSAVDGLGEGLKVKRLLILYASGSEPEVSSVKERLHELAELRVAVAPASLGLKRAMAQTSADLAILLRDGHLLLFERSPSDLVQRQNLDIATQIQRVLAVEGPWFWGGGAASALLDPDPPIFSLTTSVGSHDRFAVPGIFALVMAFIPCVLAARSFLREVNNGTLTLLLTAPGGSWLTILGAKIAAVTATNVALFCFLIVCIEQIFGFFIKPGFFALLSVQIFAIITSSLFGMAIALFTRDTIKSYVILTFFLLANVVFTGFIWPIPKAPSMVASISILFPLTFSKPFLEGWIFYGDHPYWNPAGAWWLMLQTAVGLALVWVSARLFRNNL